MKKFLTTFIAIVSYCVIMFSQHISGHITDINNIPLQMVFVYAKHSRKATVTNKDGNFILHDVLNADTLILTHVGFSCEKLPITLLNNSTVKLKRKIYEINQVDISAYSAEKIVNKAIANIKKNYYAKHNKVRGFLREEWYKADTLKAVSEAILLSSFPKRYNKSAKINIIDKQTLYSEDKSFNNVLINSPLSIIGVNDVFSRKAVLNDKIKKNHTFSFNGSFQDVDGSLVNIIEFKHKKNRRHKKAFYGKLYIRDDDYAIIYSRISNNRTTVEANYKKINGYYTTSRLFAEKQKVVGNDTARIKVSYVTTNFNPSVKNEGKRFYENEALQEYENKYDDDFWIKNISILPDSILKFKIQQLKSSQVKLEKKYNAGNNKKIETKKVLYKPSLAFSLSNHSFNDLDLLSYNINEINNLASYYISTGIRNPNLSSITQIAFISFLSLPFQFAEAERRVLNFNGYSSSEFPFSFNPFLSSYNKGLTNSELSDFKNNNSNNFLRLFTVRYETNLNTIKRIEEKLFGTNFLDKKNQKDFLEIYFVDYLIRRIYLASQFWLSAVDIEYPEKDELDMPFSTNRVNSYVKYLYLPNDNFKRTISKNGLSENEKSYAKQIRFLSIINFIPAITNLLPAIKIGESFNFRISGSYLPDCFGHQFEQNLYIADNNKMLTVMNLKEYISYYVTGFGIGIKMIDRPMFKNIYTTTQIDYWKQPKELSFYDKKLQEGFAVKQKLTWCTSKYHLFFAFTLKTKGYIDYATSLNRSSSVSLGTVIFL